MGDKYVVTGDQYLSIDRKVADIRRQLLLERGSPLDPEAVDQVMQHVGEGKSADLLASGKNPSTVSKVSKIEAALYGPYLTTVQYGRSPKTMAKAGKYPGGYNSYYDHMKWSEWKAPDGSKLIVPKRGTVKKELLLFHLGAYFGNNHCPTSEETSKVLVEHGLVMETGQTVLALGAKHSDPGTKFPVIALGSAWFDPNGNRRVAGLWHSAGGRDLDLYWVNPDGRWNPNDRVLVSRT